MPLGTAAPGGPPCIGAVSADGCTQEGHLQTSPSAICIRPLDALCIMPLSDTKGGSDQLALRPQPHRVSGSSAAADVAVEQY